MNVRGGAEKLKWGSARGAVLLETFCGLAILVENKVSDESRCDYIHIIIQDALT